MGHLVAFGTLKSWNSWNTLWPRRTLENQKNKISLIIPESIGLEKPVKNSVSRNISAWKQRDSQLFHPLLDRPERWMKILWATWIPKYSRLILNLFVLTGSPSAPAGPVAPSNPGGPAGPGGPAICCTMEPSPSRTTSAAGPGGPGGPRGPWAPRSPFFPE